MLLSYINNNICNNEESTSNNTEATTINQYATGGLVSECCTDLSLQLPCNNNLHSSNLIV